MQLMLADARNPLLHFSHALVRHVLDEGSVPLLVLNKSDLIPAQAALEWKRFFEERYPGIRVVSGSTRSADGSGGRTGAGGTVERGSAFAIMEAILSTTLCKGGVKTKVSDLIGMHKAEQVLEVARDRATMTKRRPAQDQAQSSCAVQSAPEALVQQLAIDNDSLVDEGEEEGEEEEWNVKGTKMKKKLAKKKKRSGQSHQGQVMQMRVGPVSAAASQRSKDVKAVPSLSADEEEEAEDDEDVEDDEEERDSGGDGDGADDFEDYEQEEMSEEPDHLASCPNPANPNPNAASKSKSRASVVICMVGEPNVGKSSTLNSLLGVHRVSVSAHPGRTKHYQTIWMTDKMMLCDCPGLVFPRAGVSLPMQILFGSFPIARCRDPYSVVEYLAVRIWPRLHLSLGLKKVRDKEDHHPSIAEGGEDEWSVQEILDAVAEKRGWKSKQGRLDAYRAANWMLRQALAGRSPCSLAFLPPQ